MTAPQDPGVGIKEGGFGGLPNPFGDDLHPPRPSMAPDLVTEDGFHVWVDALESGTRLHVAVSPAPRKPIGREFLGPHPRIYSSGAGAIGEVYLTDRWVWRWGWPLLRRLSRDDLVGWLVEDVLERARAQHRSRLESEEAAAAAIQRVLERRRGG